MIALFAPTDPNGFDSAAESALQSLAGPASIAVENVLLHAEATRASTIDQMTGVWNYRYLLTSLNREVERAHRFDRSLSVLMLDLDHFKRVNDTHGHQRGDAVLREFATRVQAEIREVDTLARYGGEEFAVVLPETTAAGAQNLADRICTSIRSRPFTSDEGEVPHRRDGVDRRRRSTPSTEDPPASSSKRPTGLSTPPRRAGATVGRWRWTPSEPSTARFVP